ncbi:hypothetical protein [Crocosphaera watsonii]|uniref:Capsule polysaccharide biosynthesis protein n=3 Tax=Crocosphaera watsonii TaxID=263511 RepID=G5J3H9_CROWT|nr:hypothetical protein [Crocosphaera watsonii]EHJ13242.1 hypothetical protein CWATWH0003_2055 [Crocosphaera watsonii WH 0003]CCQ54127.1 hypothetical protein CWATWH0005_5518 [Crocosphaera watsonii WH 0005]
MIDKPFNFPPKGQGEAFGLAQELLGNADSRFNYYFQELIYNVQFSQAINKKNNPFKSLHGNLVLNLAKGLIKKVKNNQESDNKFDYLINPSASTFSRNPEQELLHNLVKKTLDKNLRTCVIYGKPSIILPLKKRFVNHPNLKKLSFINPQNEIPRGYQILFKYLAAIAGKLDYQYLSNLLAEHNIHLRWSSEMISNKIYAMLSWLWVANQIEFETAILRVEWESYSFLIKETAKCRGKKTIAFQHGVISHTLDIPVTVSRFLTFGEQSAQFLQSLNQDFAKITGQTNLCNDFRPCGSVIDNIQIIPNNFEQKTVLIIDQSVDRAIGFNGLKEQIKTLDELLEKLLMQENIKKVIIRPHPEATISDAWISCKCHYPDKCDFSNAKFPLDMDISRSSVAIGLFSGALAIAAASGLPTYWLKTVDGYYTGDLSCFDEFTFFSEDILEDIQKIMSSEKLYLERRNRILEVSQQYYKNNQKINFDEHFWQMFIE